MRCLILGLVLLWFPATVFASCTFNTSLYRNELSQPSQIIEIRVLHKNYRDWIINAVRIETSDSPNIPERFKKRFDATVYVEYAFGTCEYEARVRQSGDWRDHFYFTEDGNLLQSIDVRLEQGNILNAVSFKLLLPQTRQGINEIYGVSILRHLGIIVPETFFVRGSVNGTSLIYLFQENARKELLERNGRREGPIYEGDESLLWEDIADFREYEEVALARLVNDNWAVRNSAATSIALQGYALLTLAYQNHGEELQEGRSNGATSLFSGCQNVQMSVFETAIHALNGAHALRPHNRRFYFNAIGGFIEPIYYDGSLRVLSDISNETPLFEDLRRSNRQELINSLDIILSSTNEENFERDIFQFIVERSWVVNPRDDEILEFVNQFRQNIEHIKALIGTWDAPIGASSDCIYKRAETILSEYLDRQSSLQTRRIPLEVAQNNNTYQIVDIDMVENGHTLPSPIPNVDLIRLISENVLDNEEASVVSVNIEAEDTVSIELLGGSVHHSSDVSISIDYEESVFRINFYDPTGWLLIEGVDLTGWRIISTSSSDLIGMQDDTSSRFNQFGLTGCLTLYETNLQRTSVEAYNSHCEDALNIINSRGHLSEIIIRNAFQDAIDFDVSDLEIGLIEVETAGNDCLDVSFGHYIFDIVALLNCGDKGMSVGEMSRVEVGQLAVTTASTAIAVKDGAEAQLNELQADGVGICVAAYQKKQEFLGGFVSLSTTNCAGLITTDAYSFVDQDAQYEF